MKKTLTCICMITLLLLLGCLTVSASTLETMPDSYTEMEDHLPEDVVDLLPDGLFSADPEEAMNAAEGMTRPEYLFRVVLESVGVQIGDVTPLLFSLLGIILLSAVLHRLRETVAGGGEGVSFILRLCMFALIVTRASAVVSQVQDFYHRVSGLMTGLIPVMGGLYAMGGNITMAAANQEILLIFLKVCEYVTVTVTPLMCGICLAFTLLDVFGGGMQVRFAPLSALIKKWYTFLLGLIMFLLSVALSAQSILAAGADSLSMKGIRYAVGQMIPVVGGAIAGTLGTVAAGVGMLRSVAGVSGIILVGLMLLPTLIRLLLFRACYQLAGALATVLGCDGEAGLLGEIGSLYGYVAAAVSICAVVCVLALGIFSHTAVALG